MLEQALDNKSTERVDLRTPSNLVVEFESKLQPQIGSALKSDAQVEALDFGSSNPLIAMRC